MPPPAFACYQGAAVPSSASAEDLDAVARHETALLLALKTVRETGERTVAVRGAA